jgi:integrase
MPHARFTKGFVEQTMPSTKNVIFYDTDLRGLELRVTPAGKRVFYVYYRAKGAKLQQRRHKLGDYPKITVQQAREQAKAVLGRVAGGGDPSAERKKERDRLNSGRIDEIIEQFLFQHASRNRSFSETERIFRRDVMPLWGKRSIHSITKPDVVALVRNKADTSPTMANRLLATVRKFFNWCYSNSIIESSPAEGISALSREIVRDRLLNDDELRAVIAACRATGYPFGSLVELLAVTGQRREEVAAMEWREIDFQSSTWTIPAERSKNGKAHIVHLSAFALRILEAAPRIGPFVFTTTGNKPFQGFSKSKARLDQASNVTNWRLHDLRRTIVSGMARKRVAPHVADKILNHQAHTLPGAARVYQQHDFLDERRDALDLWSDHIDALMAAKPDTEQKAA